MNGRWYQVPIVYGGNYAFVDISYSLASFDNQELTVEWDWLYGSLDYGEYRIVKEIMDYINTEVSDSDSHYLTAEFIVY